MLSQSPIHSSVRDKQIKAIELMLASNVLTCAGQLPISTKAIIWQYVFATDYSNNPEKQELEDRAVIHLADEIDNVYNSLSNLVTDIEDGIARHLKGSKLTKIVQIRTNDFPDVEVTYTRIETDEDVRKRLKQYGLQQHYRQYKDAIENYDFTEYQKYLELKTKYNK
jgi:hypothetical protein